MFQRLKYINHPHPDQLTNIHRVNLLMDRDTMLMTGIFPFHVSCTDYYLELHRYVEF